MHYINLPNDKVNFYHRGKSNRFFKKFLPIFLILSVVILSIVLWSVLSGTKSVVRLIWQQSLLQSTDDKINVLLLGNAGGTHQGPYLTDTVMVASFNLKNHQLYLISLPRDLWLDQSKTKLNAVYELGQSRGNGLDFTKQTIGSILGIPIHYLIRIDFRGFIQAIDQAGGLDINIAHSFDDYLYPIEGKEDDLCGWSEAEKEFSEEEAKKLNISPGKQKVLIKDSQIATDSAEEDKGFQYFACRFEHISFKQGLTHLDGDTALKFVRSRHGSEDEGTDFARSKRQQLVLEAFRKKVLSLQTLSSPEKLKSLLDNFGKSFETDLSIPEAIEFYGQIKKLDSTHSLVIDDSTHKDLLVNPPYQDYGGAYVLIPKGGNFDKIHQYVSKILKGEVGDEEASTSARSSNH